MGAVCSKLNAQIVVVFAIKRFTLWKSAKFRENKLEISIAEPQQVDAAPSLVKTIMRPDAAPAPSKLQ
jgi:hypothetical protein